MPISKSSKFLSFMKMNRPAGVSDEDWAPVEAYLSERNTFAPHKNHLAGARAIARLHEIATRGRGPQINFDVNKPKGRLTSWQRGVTGKNPSGPYSHTTRENWWSEIAPLFVHPNTPEEEKGLVDTLRQRVIQHEAPGTAGKEKRGESRGYHGMGYVSPDELKPMEDRSRGRWGKREVTPSEQQTEGPRPDTPMIPGIPEYFPNVDWRAEGMGQTETEDIPKVIKKHYSVSKLVKLVKEGDGGAAIDGLSGVVFTSENAGVFTPTHGGHHTTAKKRRHIKREHDEKRKELLGKQKKNGVARLEQFVREGSPITKAPQELPLERRKNMSGRPGTEYTPNNHSNNPHILNWEQEGEKRAIGKDNEPNSSLSGLNSSMEQGMEGTIPQGEDPSVAMQKVPGKQQWNDNNAIIQKYSPGNVTSMGIQPDQNPEAEPPKYIERGKSQAENKNQQQDVKMNDITNKVKKFQDEDADVEQPVGALGMAVREVNKQISPWGSGGSIDRDEIKRGGDLDEIEDDEDKKEEPSESELVIEAIKRLQERKQKHLDKGADDALFLAMMEDIDAV